MKPDETSIDTTQLDVALQLLENAAVARTVTVLVVSEHSGHQIDTIPASRDVDDEVFVELVSRCPNLRSIVMDSWSFTSVRPDLLSRCSFSRLDSLSIGSRSTLTVKGFFGLLSLMPALKRLSLRRVDSFDGSGSPETSDMPAPACSLTHLFVLDDWDINFLHYPLLLSQSHDTLEFVELQWIFFDGVADEVVKALGHCTRLRHLTLVGNDFSNERIIAACPSVSSLTLLRAPKDIELEALRAPLFTLQLMNCFSVQPDKYVDLAWQEIRARLSLMPTLREITFYLLGKELVREMGSRREMCRVCKERRIRLRVL